MKITIINGTNRVGNQSMNISCEVQTIASSAGHAVHLVDLTNFDALFRGEHTTRANATIEQRKDLDLLVASDMILFVVPTYHTGIPASLKNFLDMIKCVECFDRKVIGFISSNTHNHDYGARQSAQVVNGILSYNKLRSFVVPMISVINYEAIDRERLENFIQYCSKFTSQAFHCLDC